MLPNLLATRRGRLAAFFSMYLVEGIPYGLAGVALATQLRRQGVGPAAIGAFVGVFFLPLALKWAFAPFVDLLRSRRFGHRRAWLLAMQVAMAGTMLALMAVPLPSGMAVFSAILFAHSVCTAVHDVAADSLAVLTLAEEERGAANGLMFAGAALGHAVGGSGVLFVLAGGLPVAAAFAGIAGLILAVTTFVVLPMREGTTTHDVVAPVEAPSPTRSWRTAARTARDFAGRAIDAFTGSRAAFAGLLFVLLPCGAFSLGSALFSSLAVEFGMADAPLASLNFWTTVVAAVAMVAGGWASDRFGRRRMLAVYVVGMSLPVLYLMAAMLAQGYVMPRAPGGPAQPALVSALWIAAFAYSAIGGLMVGTRAALVMDVTQPAVAATQFTAYMALINLSMALGAAWQGAAAEAWGYPATLGLDALLGLACLLCLPVMADTAPSAAPAKAARRRLLHVLLGTACLSWVAYWPSRELFGAAHGVAGTLYGFVFVGAALVLAGRRDMSASTRERGGSPLATGGADHGWQPVLALLLLAVAARPWLAQVPAPSGLVPLATALLYAVPGLAGVLLLRPVAPQTMSPGLTH